MNILVFDIETIPDVESARRLHEWNDLSDQDVAEAMFALRRQESGSDFIRLHFQKIVAISLVMQTPQQLQVWSLGSHDSSEAELIQRFFDGIQRYTPSLVSWNGTGFDLPVLHYRSLLHGIEASRYWETGNEDQSFRWNNYLNRYHERHLDLMDVLSAYQPRAAARLDEIATLLGFPGKIGMSGDKVWNAYQEGHIEEIRNYCETDVLNTYLIYLRFQLIRGHYTKKDYDNQIQIVHDYIKASDKTHWKKFSEAWKEFPQSSLKVKSE